MTCIEFIEITLGPDRKHLTGEMTRAERSAIITHAQACDKCFDLIQKQYDKTYGQLSIRQQIVMAMEALSIRLADQQDPECAPEITDDAATPAGAQGPGKARF